jgi:rubrerythrin
LEGEHAIDARETTIPPYPLLAEAESRRRNSRFELRCARCGYRVVSAKLIRCPMCGDEAWEFAEWRPFKR